MPNTTQNTAIQCPTCKATTLWQGNPHRPFCSARCKDGDFLDWANEKHRLSADHINLNDDSDFASPENEE